MDMVKFDGKECPVTHLGDGVYMIYDGFGFWLYANDHQFPTDRIYLEPEIIKALNNFVNEVKV